MLLLLYCLLHKIMKITTIQREYHNDNNMKIQTFLMSRYIRTLCAMYPPGSHKYHRRGVAQRARPTQDGRTIRAPLFQIST